MGGGIVLVPVLFHVFTEFGIDEQVRMQLAVGTSLATIIFTAWRSVAAHRARGAVDDALLRAWVVPLLIGVALGSASARVLAGPALMALFAVVALVVAFHMVFGSEEWRLADLPPAGAARHALGAVVGMFSMLMGLGGGTLGVPIFTLLGVPSHRAVGTAAGLELIGGDADDVALSHLCQALTERGLLVNRRAGLACYVIAIPGTLGWLWAGLGVPGRPPLSLGYVNAVGLVLIVPATMLTAPWGARLAHAVPRRTLRRAFALFLALTSLRMLLELR